MRVVCLCEQPARGSRRLTAANQLEGGGRAAQAAALPPPCDLPLSVGYVSFCSRADAAHARGYRTVRVVGRRWRADARGRVFYESVSEGANILRDLITSRDTLE